MSEPDFPVPLDELRRASTEALLERHVGAPLRALSADLMTEVAVRVAVVLADLDSLLAAVPPEQVRDGSHGEHCWRWHAPCLAARIRTALTGEEST